MRGRERQIAQRLAFSVGSCVERARGLWRESKGEGLRGRGCERREFFLSLFPLSSSSQPMPKLIRNLDISAVTEFYVDGEG